MGAYEYQGNLESPVTPDENNIVYVDSNVDIEAAGYTGAGDSWANALRFLSDATDAAQTNTAIQEIHVAQGTYYPTGPQNDINRERSFAIVRGGLKLLGGFPTGGGVRSQSLIEETVLSGDINVSGDHADNSYNVLVIAGVDATADSVIVDGFTITGGNADTYVLKVYNGQQVNALNGGGLYAVGLSSNTVVRNSIFSGNYATGQGGAIFNRHSSLTLSRLLIEDNVGGSGAGICVDNGSRPLMEHLQILNNEANAYWGGGGLYVNGTTASPVVRNVVISGNIATTSNYSATSHGGGITISGGSPDIESVIITGNQADLGGGVYMSSNSNEDPHLTN